jgi:hypothetical protein
MSNFHVGQQVVCVDDQWDDDDQVERPVRGRVYTIRSIIGSLDCLQLVEISNRPKRYREGYAECAFFSRRFRPLRKTSIEVFERMLIKAPEGVS